MKEYEYDGEKYIFDGKRWLMSNKLVAPRDVAKKLSELLERETEDNVELRSDSDEPLYSVDSSSEKPACIIKKRIITKDPEIYRRAYSILKTIYGPEAEFHQGQYEAIEAVVTNKRTLVIQKTGWGKSLVYFIATKLLNGITIVVSPLLVLMKNQQEAANRMGLKCITLNHEVKEEERIEALRDLKAGECDVFFTTPETLYRDEVQSILPNLNIGLFVVDECHCISDWGHDFRLEYGKINRIIEIMPKHVSILGTTATANNRVIEDLKKQFGDDVYVSRGPLTRESLHIEILRLESKAERYAWLAKNINKIPGVGIIYCITQSDCNQLADFLNKHNIVSRPYHSGSELKDTIKETEELFGDNKIKVLVATIKMGMGYDKSDIGFIIHFQRPSSLVAYYQQIGRAGRSEGAEAYCYLMTGEEDKEINEYFIENAFPTEEQEKQVIKALEDARDGLKEKDLFKASNISYKALNRCLMFLINQNVIFQDSKTKRYYRSMNPYHYQGAYYDAVKSVKRNELVALDNYIEHKGCLSRYVVEALNDNTAHDCGKCSNCLKHGILEGIVLPPDDLVNSVQNYLGNLLNRIEPRRRWGENNNPFDENSIISSPNEEGIVLARYGDAGYGKMVAHDKYHEDAFRNELIDKTVSILKTEIGKAGYSVITNIPSARNTKVAVFAKMVADNLGYEYMNLLDVTGSGGQQKKMQNTYYQYRNAVDKLKIREEVDDLNGLNIILIDDLVDSKWTITVAGGLLKLMGAGKVFPFCLADSSQKEG